MKKLKLANTGNIIKLPRGSYMLPKKDFIKLINKYPKEMKIAFLKKKKTIMSAVNAKEEGYKKGTAKLNELQKIEIIELASRFFTPRQIMDVIRGEWKLKYSNVSLNNFLKRNVNIIKNKRMKYLSSTDSLRLVHERPRVEELSEIYEEAKKEGLRKLQLEALKEIRQEVKGDTLKIEKHISANINLNIRQHLLQEVDVSNFAKLAFIKILEKHNIEPMKLVHRLKLQTEVVDPVTKEIIENKVLPVKTDGLNNLISDAKVLEEKKLEEKDFNNIDNIKKLLKKKLLLKSKKLEKVEKSVFEKQGGFDERKK